MKKLILLLFLALSMASCSAQEPIFEKAEYQPPLFTTVTGVLALSADGTASVVKNNEYQRVFHFDSKVDMVDGWEYVVRLKIEHPEDLEGKKLVTATLVKYGISPKQARINAVEISKAGRTDQL